MYFAAIVGIDGTRSVEHGDAMSQGEPRTRPDLPFETLRKRNGDAGRDGRALARREDHGRIGRHRRDEIEPGRELALIGRKRQIGGMRQPHHADLDFIHCLAPTRKVIRRCGR